MRRDTGGLLAELTLPPRFTVVRKIGEGAMGIVYEAIDEERGTRVALKTVLRRDAAALARFKREFRALQDISHPNLVSLGELFGEGDNWFFTMELVSGCELMEWIRGDIRASASGVYALAETLDSSLPLKPTDTIDDYERTNPEVTRGPACDLVRLRDAVRQIAQGLVALHAAGKVHRDVKPSNIRITPDGRVVILDFGLVFELDHAHGSTGMNVVGTPAYMAPEQATASAVGPEADWYALGAILYECLTGELPFNGAPLTVLMDKQNSEPLPPSARTPGIPADLDALCVALMHFDPRSRPLPSDILKCFEVTTSLPDASSSSATNSLAPFVGRTDEVEILSRALAEVEAGKTVTVALHGESGIGKSSIVRRFLEGAQSKRADLAVLAGRCYERETVPYKALDGVVDALTRHLVHLPRAEAEGFLPTRVSPLAHVFPVLCRIPAVAKAAVAPLTLDPLEIRRRAFAALRELLSRLSARQSVIVVIDDLQWTDADSLLLLGDILRPPEAPSILLVVTLRSTGERDDAQTMGVLRAIPGDVRPVHVGRLHDADARALAGILLDRAGNVNAAAKTIIEETGGHPLFMDELVRHASTLGDASPTLRLDDMVWQRVVDLDESARRVLETVCVFGVPFPQSTIARAVGVEMAAFTRTASVLRVANLVRTGGARGSDVIEPYHDRIREAVVARLEGEARRELHERIAESLEASGANDPEVLAVHWIAAGQGGRGAAHMIAAADQATRTLAFDRAARLYGSALALLPEDDARRRSLRASRGNAFANAGRGPLAAEEYEAAARGAEAADALDFQRRAAEQLLRSALVAQGMDATREVLAAVGMRLPETRFGTLVQFLFLRLIVALRGLSFRPRDASQIARSELTKIDVCWSVSFTLTYVDAMRGAVFQMRHLLRALAAGEPQRVARALAMETSYTASLGMPAWRRTERLIERSQAVAENAGPYARALALGTAGIAHVLNSHNQRGVSMLDRAVEMLSEQCPGSSWEVTSARFFAFCGRAYSGRFHELIPMHESALQGARARGDLYGGVMLRVGMMNRRWLVTDEPARARAELDEAMGSWTVDGFQLMHFHALLAESYIDWYEGNAPRALARIEAKRSALRRSLLLHIESVRLECLALETHAQLQMVWHVGGNDRKEVLRRAKRSLRGFKREKAPMVAWYCALYRAGIAMAEGNVPQATAHLRHARNTRPEDAPVYFDMAIDWALAGVRGGPDAEREQHEALERIRGEGVVSPLRYMRLTLPGWPLNAEERAALANGTAASPSRAGDSSA